MASLRAPATPLSRTLWRLQRARTTAARTTTTTITRTRVLSRSLSLTTPTSHTRPSATLTGYPVSPHPHRTRRPPPPPSRAARLHHVRASMPTARSPTLHRPDSLAAFLLLLKLSMIRPASAERCSTRTHMLQSGHPSRLASPLPVAVRRRLPRADLPHRATRRTVVTGEWSHAGPLDTWKHFIVVHRRARTLSHRRLCYYSCLVTWLRFTLTYHGHDFPICI